MHHARLQFERARRFAAPFGIALLLVLPSSCISIDGGAVEARWTLRTIDGRAVACTDDRARISTIRFVLAPQDGDAIDDPCAVGTTCLFPCDPGVGTTPFVIPEGSYAMSLLPLDETDTPLDSSDGITVPAPTVRQIRRGQLTNLNVNLFIVNR